VGCRGHARAPQPARDGRDLERQRVIPLREKRKDGLFSYGFLLDRDVSKAVSHFPRKGTKTLADIGLPQHATDAEIVRAAWERDLTIVTGNGVDFTCEIHKFLPKKAAAGCRTNLEVGHRKAHLG